MRPHRLLEHRSKPHEAGLESAIVGSTAQHGRATEDNISGNVEFANHYSIITGSSRKSPKTPTVSRQALVGDDRQRAWPKKIWVCIIDPPVFVGENAGAAAFLTLDCDRAFGQVRQTSVIRDAPRNYPKIWLQFLLLDEILVHRVTRNSGAGVLRGTRADGVLASPASSALAPMWHRGLQCKSIDFARATAVTVLAALAPNRGKKFEMHRQG
ncbi:hypothetical protein SVAN01_01636 [Stagonosporopsis vannaccii]|nr:hypothetical protein SVAN01_01636 [Stagonosporopsis vannaccii]